MPEIYKLARPKLHGVPFSINAMGQLNKEIKPRMAREILSGLPCFVGEIVVGIPQAEDCERRTKFFTDHEEHMQPFVAWVYDLRTSRPMNLRERLNIAESFVQSCGPYVQFVDHQLIETPEQLREYNDLLYKDGWERMVLREPFGTFGTEDEEVEILPPASEGAEEAEAVS